MTLNMSSHVIVQSLEIASKLFHLPVSTIIGKSRKANIVAARQAVLHGLVTSGAFNVTSVSRCFCYNTYTVQYGLQKVNDIIRKPYDALQFKTAELSALVKAYVLANHTDLVKFDPNARPYEQAIVPVVRPEWQLSDIEKCSIHGTVLTDGFLILATPAKISFYPEPMAALLKRYKWDSDYVWIKPRVI